MNADEARWHEQMVKGQAGQAQCPNYATEVCIATRDTPPAVTDKRLVCVQCVYERSVSEHIRRQGIPMSESGR